MSELKFKLHAPAKTTFEVELQDGKVISIKVTPESRAKDIILMFKWGPAKSVLKNENSPIHAIPFVE